MNPDLKRLLRSYIYPCLCVRCGWWWMSRIPNPVKCSRCGGIWNQPRHVIGRGIFEHLILLETDACILWPLSVIGGGYGRFKVKRRTVLVHRLAYQRRVGPIPATMEVLHRCDHPPCFNYRHLFTGTEQDNTDDKVNKWRHRFGMIHPRAKLTDELIATIRSEYVFGSATSGTYALAEKYGVSQTNVSRIVRREIWRHLQ